MTIKHAQPKSAVPLREVLYQFAMAKDVPDVDLLDEFVRQYPQHAEALTDFAVELVVDSLQDNRHEVRRIIMEATRTDCIERCLNNIRSALLDLERLKADRSLWDGDKPEERARLHAERLRAWAAKIAETESPEVAEWAADLVKRKLGED